MKPSDIFSVAIRLLGLFFLYLAVRSAAVLLTSPPGEVAWGFFLHAALYVGVGWWLVGGASLVMERAYPTEPGQRGWRPDGAALAIVLMCVAAAVCYGIAVDQVTVRMSSEWFTSFHRPVPGAVDQTLLATYWGIVATWWVGLLLGVPLAVVARAGSRPKRPVGSLILPVVCLLGAMAACAFIAGLVGWQLACDGAAFLDRQTAGGLPAGREVPFHAVTWAHAASYLTALFGGIVVMVMVWRSRGPAAALRDAEPTAAVERGRSDVFGDL